MSFADELDDVPDVCPSERGLIVARLSPAQRAAIRAELVVIFETSCDVATIEAAKALLDAMDRRTA